MSDRPLDLIGVADNPYTACQHGGIPGWKIERCARRSFHSVRLLSAILMPRLMTNTSILAVITCYI